jgi:hypothetical protein
MPNSNHDAGLGLFRGASYINASNGFFNQAGRDQYIYNNPLKDEMMVR